MKRPAFLTKILDKIVYLRRLPVIASEVGRYFPGHYYSPIPSRKEVEEYCAGLPHVDGVRDVDLHRDEQRLLLEQFAKFYSEMPHLTGGNDTLRYSFDQGWFCHSDAIMLYSFIRHFQPRRIVEIGSGHSSAMILDTLEKFGGAETEVTFIDPHPERLESILREGDRDKVKVKIIPKRVQDVDVDLFQQLTRDDLLFIDSSHVLKVGSDLQHILFKIVPFLPVGVHMHFHDIFYPFEYPVEWLKFGRYWNELYMIRAFLAGNRVWQVTMFNEFVNKEFGALLEEKMPACREDFGSSLYITRVAE